MDIKKVNSMNMIDKMLLISNVLKEIYKQRQRFISLAYDKDLAMLGYNLLSSNEKIENSLKEFLKMDMQVKEGNIFYYNKMGILEQHEVFLYEFENKDLDLFYGALNLDNGNVSFLGADLELLEEVNYEDKVYKSSLKTSSLVGTDIDLEEINYQK